MTGWKTRATDWSKTILLTVILALGLRAVVVEAYVVPTGSMRPTILEGDYLLGSKFHYWIWRPERGDVVVFRPPEAALLLSEEDVSRYVKRVVAVAGDEVQIRGGMLRVNGDRIDEPYLAEAPLYTLPSTVVPAGHIFVLGDNRNESLDSHRWGFLEEDALIAHVFARYWPPQRISGL